MNATKRHPLSNKDRYYILARDGFTCQYCGGKAPDVTLHADHIIPVARGGKNDPDNLVAACDACNLSKQASPLLPHVIDRMRMAIRIRADHYATYLLAHPLQEPASAPNVYPRPKEQLRAHPFIQEPVRNRALHPDKRHAIGIQVAKTGAVFLTYLRQERTKWVEATVGYCPKTATSMPPLPPKTFQALYKQGAFSIADTVSEGDITAHVAVDQTGMHLLFVETTKGTTTYGFWAPLPELEIALTLEDTIETEPDAFDYPESGGDAL